MKIFFLVKIIDSNASQLCAFELCTVKKHDNLLPPIRSRPNHLLSVPHSSYLRVPHLLLQLENTVHQRLRCRRTTRHIDIYRHNPITAPSNTITIVIVTATIRTTAHRDDPSRLRHLIVHLSQRWRHLVRQRTSYYHNVGLARGCSEDYAEAILIVARRR